MRILLKEHNRLFMLLGLFLICALTGFMAGWFFKSRSYDAQAASANIIVSNNNQVITQDQSAGTQEITRISTVTVKDSSATSGYTLSARLSQNTIPNATITIGSDSSVLCTLSSPCTLSSTPRDIGKQITTQVTTPSGDTTAWIVTITIPGSTPLGNYLLDIEYEEQMIPDLTTITTMQQATTTLCDNSISGLTINLADTRDNKIYKVKKMIDGRCWMIDNLAYDIRIASGRPAYNPSPALISGSTTSVSNRAQYAANTGYTTSSGQTPYLYNWCAALGDTSPNCTSSENALTNQTVINGTPTTTGTIAYQPDNPGICPAPFRLPKGGPEAISSDPATTANEFAKLDIAMGGTGTNLPNANTYPMFTGTTTASDHWSGVLGGIYTNGFIYQGSHGYWWSSTVYSAPTPYNTAYDLMLRDDDSYVIPAGGNYKSNANAIRCILAS